MIQVLLDQGRAPRAAALLAERGMNAVDVSEIGLAEAQDAEILQAERDSGRVCITLDHDFHTHLAVAGEGSPSVILLRVERTEGARASEHDRFHMPAV